MARELELDRTRIADDAPCYLIGEIGNNHGGSVTDAQVLIQSCADVGVSAVKFQKRTNATLYTRALLQQHYDHTHSFGRTYGAHRAALELSREGLRECFQFARAVGVTAFATAFDEQAVDDVMAAGSVALKVASSGLTDTPLLACVAQQGVPVLLSCGGGTMDDIARAVDVLSRASAVFSLLHCTAVYPVREYRELNLRVIPTLRTRYPDTVIGWSGHDAGICMPVVAYTLGARIIEKHVTLNRTLKGTDHAFSLEPAGLRKLVRDLNRVNLALGDGEKRRYASEEAPLRKMTRSLVAVRPLKTGYVLTAADVALRIPNDGLPPYLLPDIVGFPLALPLGTDEPITSAHIRSETHA